MKRLIVILWQASTYSNDSDGTLGISQKVKNTKLFQ